MFSRDMINVDGVANQRSGPPRRVANGLAIAGLCLLAFPSFGLASHQGGEGGPRDFAVGSGSNQFFFAVGEARLGLGAQSDPGGDNPTGHVRAKGDPDGSGPMEPFKLEGEVTCLEVRGNRAAVKYRFKHAEGSAQPFEGGGVQIFIEDNGDPSGGEAVDKTTFDPPQPAGVFDLAANACDDPSGRAGYDQIESGDFTVHQAASQTTDSAGAAPETSAPASNGEGDDEAEEGTEPDVEDIVERVRDAL